MAKGKRLVRVWFWGWLMLLLGAGLAGAADEMELFKMERFQEGPWILRADKLSYDAQTHIYEGTGRVVIRQGDRRISADKVQVNDQTKIAVLQGNVVLMQGEDIFTGKEGYLNLATHSGEMHEARLFLKRNHFHVESALIRKTGESTYYAEKADVTTCDADRPVWSFYAKKLSVVLEGYAKGTGSLLKLAGVPVIYMPFSVLPVKTTRQSGFLIPFYGQQQASGTVVETPFYWAISDHADATFYQTYLSKRGYMQGAEFRSKGHQDDAVDLRFFYLSDDSGRARTSNRYWAVGMVNQSLPGDIDLRVTMDRVSDAAYLKDFNFGYMALNRYSRTLLLGMGRDLEQEDLNVRVSNFLLSKNFNFGNLTTYSRYYERLRLDNPRPFQRVPGLNFMTVPIQLSNWPLWVGMDSSYTYFAQDHGMTGDRMDFHPHLGLQVSPLPGVFFNARGGFRETLFRVDHTVPDGPPERYISRALYDAKVSLGSAFSRDYGREGESTQFYRHILRPEVTYFNMPRYEANRIPGFDPFDLGWVVRANRNLPVREGDDPLGGVNAVTYSVANNILWRGANPQGQATVRDMLWFRFSQSVFFNSSSMAMDGTDLPHRRVSDLLGEAEFRPFRQLSVGLNLGANPTHEGFNRANIKLAFLDRRQNFLSVNYLYIKDFAQQINVVTYLNLFNSVKTWLNFAHTFQTNKQLERKYGVIFQRQCWGVNLSYTERPDDRRIGATIFIPGIGEKLKRSPVAFPDELRQGKEGPDFL